MKSRPIFHLFLTLSVVIILIGIVLVIFTQFDRGYVVIDKENSTNTKQQELIKQIAQAAAKMSLNEKQVKNEAKADTDVLTLIEQVKQDDSEINGTDLDNSQTVTDQEISRINQLNQQSYQHRQPATPTPYSGNSYEDYQQRWLSNNPWSPDYNPNRRY